MSVHHRAVTDLRSITIVSRPRFWLYLAGPVLVGATYGATSLEALASIPVIALLVYFLIPANVYLYGINDVFDANIDVLNPKKGDREAAWQGNPFILGVVVLSAIAGIALTLALPARTWPYLIGFLILGALYSAPPIRLKTKPFLDSVSNGLYILPGGAAFVFLAGSHPPVLALVGGWVWAMGMHTFSAIPDIEPDRRAGIRTTATVLGEHRTYAYCFLCWSGAMLAFGVLDIRAGALFAAYPLIILWVGVGKVSVDRAYWRFPGINTTVGMVLTIGGLWRLTGVML